MLALTVELSAIFQNIAVGVAALVTALVAALGLYRWQRELLGKENLEAARNFLRATYKVEEVIWSCRTALLAEEEFPKVDSLQPDTPSARARRAAHVYQKRGKRLRSACKEFDAAALEAEVLWGRNAQEKAKKLRVCVHALLDAFRDYVENIKSNNVYFKQDDERKKEVMWILGFPRKTEKDWFEKHGGDAITGIEELVRPYLRPKQSLSWEK